MSDLKDLIVLLYLFAGLLISLLCMLHIDIDFLFVCICPGLASGLEIISVGQTSIEKASGQSVKLDCQFTLAPEDSGPLDIEWSLLSSDNQKEDKVVRGDVPYKAYESTFCSNCLLSNGLLFSTVMLSMFREARLCSCLLAQNLCNLISCM